MEKKVPLFLASIRAWVWLAVIGIRTAVAPVFDAAALSHSLGRLFPLLLAAWALPTSSVFPPLNLVLLVAAPKLLLALPRIVTFSFFWPLFALRDPFALRDLFAL